jgi:hypothetical protein
MAQMSHLQESTRTVGGHAVRGAGIGTIGYVGPDARRRAVKRFRAGAARTMRNPPSRYPCVLAP